MKDRVGLKKKRILDAAMECFIHYGYTKTSFQDIAKKAGVSRASLYSYFKDKEDLFIAMDTRLHDKYEKESAKILNSSLSDKEKLLQIIDVWITAPYREIKNTPSANGWLDELVYISEQSELRFRKLFMMSITPIVGEAKAEIIVLSIRGLMNDRPPVATLKKRIGVLVGYLN